MAAAPPLQGFLFGKVESLISGEQMKEKWPACSEQSINTFYHPIAGSLQARVTPFKMLYLLLTKVDACDSQLMGTLIKFN